MHQDFLYRSLLYLETIFLYSERTILVKYLKITEAENIYVIIIKIII